MSKSSQNALFVLLLLFCLTACSKAKKEENKLIIATAANMQFAMKTLVQAFSKKQAIKCDLVISSSGKLTAQIKAGAPFDIFVAANMKYPNEVFNSGLAVAAPKVYAYGRLVLWSMIDTLPLSLNVLQDPSIKHIALANPKTAPYGIAAVEVLKHRQLELKGKLVYGESIAQTNQFIISKAAEMGFTALAVVRSPQMKNKGKWIEIPMNTYTPIGQGVVILKNQNEVNENAQKFYDFLFSKAAKDILIRYGYALE